MAYMAKVGPLPMAYVLWIMCKEYGCRPSEILEEDFETVMLHYDFLIEERKAQ